MSDNIQTMTTAATSNKVAVTTRSYNNYRNGSNTQETVLTSIAVQQKGIKKLFDCMLPGDLRGSEGMPLIVPNLTMADNMLHDVLFVATMSDDVWAFDANNPDPETGQGKLLWKQHIGNPIPGTKAMDMYQINDNWGILSTPVINMSTKTIYVVSMTSPTGQMNNSVFYLNALSLIDGSRQAPALNLNNATYTVKLANGTTRTSKLGNVARKQRPGLLFDSRNGVDTVFVSNGSFAESADTNQGWVIACDVTGLKLSIAAAWTTTSRYSGGGIWMGGQGPSLDDKGYIYGMTGNGAFDGITDFSECFYKLKYTPKTTTTPASLTIVDWFSPFSDAGRVGADPTVTYIADDDDAPGGSSNMDSPGDEDLNSGGPLILPMSFTGFSKDIIIGAGKDGIAYVVDMNNMGKTMPGDFAPSKIAGNYAKLLSPPYGFTFYPGNMNLAPTDLSTIQTTYGGFTHHQHSTPVAYKSPDHGIMLFTGGENGPVRAFTLMPDFTIKYLATGNEIASANVGSPGGMPGTMMTLSANGTTNSAILWCLQPVGNANNSITPGRLIAYAANWINPNGTLIKLWDSFDWNIPFMFNKFNIPTTANGKLYVPTYDGRIMVFGLAGN